MIPLPEGKARQLYEYGRPHEKGLKLNTRHSSLGINTGRAMYDRNSSITFTIRCKRSKGILRKDHPLIPKSMV